MQQLVTFAQLSLFDLNISVRYFTAFKISALKTQYGLRSPLQIKPDHKCCLLGIYKMKMILTSAYILETGK